jgi:hypothetical protein
MIGGYGGKVRIDLRRVDGRQICDSIGDLYRRCIGRMS